MNTAITATGITREPAHPLKRIFAVLIDLVIVRFCVLLIYYLLGLMFAKVPSFLLPDDSFAGGDVMTLIKRVFLVWPLLPNLLYVALADIIYFTSLLPKRAQTIGMSWLNLKLVMDEYYLNYYQRMMIVALLQVLFLHIPPLMIAWLRFDYSVPYETNLGLSVIDD